MQTESGHHLLARTSVTNVPVVLKQVIHSIASSLFQIRNRNDHRKELKTEPVDNSIAILPLHGLRRLKVNSHVQPT